MVSSWSFYADVDVLQSETYSIGVLIGEKSHTELKKYSHSPIALIRHHRILSTNDARRLVCHRFTIARGKVRAR